MSRSDELATFEQQGHRFATTLLDAGFDSQRVIDAAVGPRLRLAQLDVTHGIAVGALLLPNPPTAAWTRRFIRSGEHSEDFCNSAAFYVGVMTAIESHTKD